MDIEKQILNVKEIANLGIAEIHKEFAHSFVFRVSEKWYRLKYEHNYGAHLKFMTGYNRSDINELVSVSGPLLVGTLEKNKVDELFDFFEKYYLSGLFINSEKLIKDLQTYITLAPKVSLIQKLSEDAFIINIEGEVFSVIRAKVVDTFDLINLTSKSKVEIKSNKPKKEIKTVRFAGPIDNIFTTLNVLYYLNKNKTKEFSEKEFLEFFQ